MGAMNLKLRALAILILLSGVVFANVTGIRRFPFVPYTMFNRKIDANLAGALIPVVEFFDGRKILWIQPHQLSPFRLAYQDPQIWVWMTSEKSDRVLTRLQYWARRAEIQTNSRVRQVRLYKASRLVNGDGELQFDVGDLESRGELVLSWSGT